MEKFLKDCIGLFIILIGLLFFLIINKMVPLSSYWQPLLVPFDSSEVQEDKDTSFPSEKVPLITTTRASLFMVGDALIPVSYTHLDVYKRQVILVFCSWVAWKEDKTLWN